MKVDIKIIEELERYRKINNYITEQEATLPPPPPAGDAGALPPPPAEGAVPPPPPGDAGAVPPTGEVPPAGEPVDTATDPEVEKVGETDKKGKEIEVTDLVKSQKNVEKKQEEYFDTLFNHLNDLETKLSAMDEIMNKLNDLETKVEKYRVKTPEEKLELRSLDSGPYNQKLSDFFVDKQEDIDVMLEAVNNVSTIADEKSLQFRKGEISILIWLKTLKGVSERAYEDLNEKNV